MVTTMVDFIFITLLEPIKNMVTTIIRDTSSVMGTHEKLIVITMV